jgi:hypothetical protein
MKYVTVHDNGIIHAYDDDHNPTRISVELAGDDRRSALIDAHDRIGAELDLTAPDYAERPPPAPPGPTINELRAAVIDALVDFACPKFHDPDSLTRYDNAISALYTARHAALYTARHATQTGEG